MILVKVFIYITSFCSSEYDRITIDGVNSKCGDHADVISSCSLQILQ